MTAKRLCLKIRLIQYYDIYTFLLPFRVIQISSERMDKRRVPKLGTTSLFLGTLTEEGSS